MIKDKVGEEPTDTDRHGQTRTLCAFSVLLSGKSCVLCARVRREIGDWHHFCPHACHSCQMQIWGTIAVKNGCLSPISLLLCT